MLLKNSEIHDMNVESSELTKSPYGITVKLNIKSPLRDRGGLYQINVLNKISRILLKSNVLEIRDVNYWNSQTKPSNHYSVLEDERVMPYPLVLECASAKLDLPAWFLQYASPVLWKFCEIDSFKRKGIKCNDVFLKHKIDFEGNLVLTSSSKLNNNMVTFCYKKDRDIFLNVFYNNPAIFIETQLFAVNPISSLLKKVDPIQDKTIIIVSGKNLRPIILSGVYNLEFIDSLKWLKDGNDISKSLKITIESNQIIFPEVITPSHAGSYHLLVKKGNEFITFIFNIVVQSPPVLKNMNCLPKINFLWEDSTLNLKCLYEGESKELTASINENNLILSSSHMSPITKYYPSLLHLQAKSMRSQDVLLYSVTNLKYDQDHTVTFQAKNDYGQHIQSSKIVIMKKLKVHFSREIVSLISTKFTCNFSPLFYNIKGIKSKIIWRKNGKKLSNDIFEFITLNSNKNELILTLDPKSNIEDIEKARTLLHGAEISCNIELWYPGLKSTLIYDSRNDVSTKEKLSSTININVDKYYVLYFDLVFSALCPTLLIIFIILLCVLIKNCFFTMSSIEEKVIEKLNIAKTNNPNFNESSVYSPGSAGGYYSSVIYTDRPYMS